ncbi:MAG: hypothetical protein HZA60_10800 [Deltaproteobacteria bacterium]|nr:hypothetical protein [Deltaproteobacteria bacterium]
MTRRETLRGLPPPAVAMLALLLLTAAAAAAAAPAPVTVDIGVVVASNQGSSVDPALSTLRPKLQSMFPYSSYKMLDRKRRTLAVGETGDFDLPGNRMMRVTPLPAPERKVRLAIQIMEGGRNLLTTTLAFPRGGMAPVVANPYQSGVMILLLSAE